MINYTLKQLYSFEAVIRLGGFTSASKELHITQPAVYMQVQQLQNNIGAKIFNISGKKITPTFIGNKIYETAVKAINVVENSKLEINQSLNPDSGHLQIAVATTANSFVSNLLSKFKKEFPKMTFYMDVTNRHSLLDNLKNHNADIVIMGEPPKNIPLISHAFMKNPLIAIAHPKNELLTKNKVTIKDLAKETLLTREVGSGTRITVDGDTSTNDACTLSATNQSGVQLRDCLNDFQIALNEMTKTLAHMIVRDGEGATKFVEIHTSGLDTAEECLEVAYTVAHSPLVKTALFASDANWGRILAAVGRSKVTGISIENIDIYLNDLQIIASGEPSLDYTESKGSAEMQKSEITIRINLGDANTTESVWTTDLSCDYVKINAEYRT